MDRDRQREVNVLSVLLKSRGLISSDAKWQLLDGGKTNLVWRVTGTEDLICKLFMNHEENPIFANTPLAEFDCLSALQGSQIAPEPKAFLETSLGSVLLYYYVDGEMWSSGVEGVADIIAKVQKIEPVSGLRVLSPEPESVRAHTKEILQNVKTDLAREIFSAEPPALEIAEVELCLLHTDIVPNNLISTSDGLKLIDWQCPAVGDPVLDVITFISPAMHSVYTGKVLNQDDQVAFLSCFPKSIQERYMRLAPLLHWRMAAYCSWKASRKAEGYEEASRIELAFCQAVDA